ncbi:MAG: hypothetical protein U1F70_09055 [Candidatus Competibacteraceae bacterium]
MLAHFGHAIRPEPRPWKDAEAQALTAVIQRRRQVVEMLTAEKNRLASAHPHVKPGSSSDHAPAGTTPQGSRPRPPATGCAPVRFGANGTTSCAACLRHWPR